MGYNGLTCLLFIKKCLQHDFSIAVWLDVLKQIQFAVKKSTVDKQINGWFKKKKKKPLTRFTKGN